jgi:hypothetical protein
MNILESPSAPNSPWKWYTKFMEDMVVFGQNLNFILTEGEQAMWDIYVETIRADGFGHIDRLIWTPWHTQFVILPVYPAEVFGAGAVDYIESELKQVFIEWKEYFVQKMHAGETVYKNTMMYVSVKYGNMEGISRWECKDGICIIISPEDIR